MDKVGPPQFAESASAPAPTGIGAHHQMTLRDGFRVAIENRAPGPDEKYLIHGEDMVKFHVRLSGRRHLLFEGRHFIPLEGPSTAVLMHDHGVRKIDHVLPDCFERSITIAMKRELFAAYLDAEQSKSPAVLDALLNRYAHRPRLINDKVSVQEARTMAAILGCSRVGPTRQLFLEAKSLELICLLLDRLDEAAPQGSAHIRLTDRDRRQLARVRERLESGFMDPPTIHELARQFGLNRNKLCTGFKVLFGVSIFDFCNNLRMEEAHLLLHQSHLTITTIAAKMGYSSVSAFSSAFRRVYGCAPTQARAERGRDGARSHPATNTT
jgi:AraC family transcriptional regulator, transcriptional activator of the genes for pyochelin and ferripyochelin receptors